MVLSEIFRGNNEVREAARAGVQIDTVSVASASDAASAADGSGKITGAIRPPAVAGSFYPLTAQRSSNSLPINWITVERCCNSWSPRFQRECQRL